MVVNVCWELNAPSDKVDFMDLTITITECKISTSLFEKPLNLHLYIPPHSVHPPGLLPGIVHSTLKSLGCDFIGDRLVLGVGVGVVRSIVVVPALGSVLTLFCWLVVSLVTIGFIVVGYTHTKHALKTSEASLQCYFVTN